MNQTEFSWRGPRPGGYKGKKPRTLGSLLLSLNCPQQPEEWAVLREERPDKSLENTSIWCFQSGFLCTLEISPEYEDIRSIIKMNDCIQLVQTCLFPGAGILLYAKLEYVGIFCRNIIPSSLLKVRQCSKLPYEKLSLKRAQMRSPTQDGESVPPYNLCLPMHKQKCAPQIGGSTPARYEQWQQGPSHGCKKLSWCTGTKTKSGTSPPFLWPVSICRARRHTNDWLGPVLVRKGLLGTWRCNHGHDNFLSSLVSPPWLQPAVYSTGPSNNQNKADHQTKACSNSSASRKTQQGVGVGPGGNYTHSGKDIMGEITCCTGSK
ncbi:hypothetical protein Anapl_12097 [Anas platyrhynchos]|uniref:Uncharacterized protein n=1 Tax=Anas platyrhynchos TaxID=8839 RepID=R0LFK6_ANAPL|nr:hypothetical protein Anapl_12097 [Anas platyrhynchos]